MKNGRWNAYGNIGLFEILQIALIVLRLARIIRWPWVWVFIPVWGPILLIVLCFAGCCIAEFFEEALENLKKRKG